jgi:hypothetical protein
MSEPGLDLHDWETRWQQLVEVAAESPGDSASELCRLVEEMLGEPEILEAENEARKQFEAARELELRYERDGDPGDLAAAVNGYRAVYALVMPGELNPDADGGRTA